MNFVSIIQNTKHYHDFCIWFWTNYSDRLTFGLILFLDLPMEFQQGVYIKYIESKGYKVVKRSHWWIDLPGSPFTQHMQRKNFKDFILEVFNHDKFVKNE